MFDSLWPCGLQHASLPCPSPIPRACSNSCPSSRWCHPPCHPLLSPSAPDFKLSQQQGLFQQVSLPIRWPESWNFNFSISVPMNISIDWFDFLAVQGTLKSLLQYHSSEVSVFWFKSIIFSALSFLYSPTLTSYMTTAKTIALTRWNFVFQEISLPFNMLSMLVMTFLSRSKSVLISWLESPFAVILEPPK